MLKFFFLSFLLVFTSAELALKEDTTFPSSYQYSFTVNPSYSVSWTMNESQKTVAMKIECGVTAWCGICFAPSTDGMSNGDMVIATFDASKKITVNDMWAKSKDTPSKDTDLGGKRNIIASRGQQTGGKTTFEFIRPLGASDKWDKEITTDFVPMSWAYGNNNGFSEHPKSGAGQFSLNFYTGQGRLGMAL
jgi:hypothetical protein